MISDTTRTLLAKIENKKEERIVFYIVLIGLMSLYAISYLYFFKFIGIDIKENFFIFHMNTITAYILTYHTIDFPLKLYFKIFKK